MTSSSSSFCLLLLCAVTATSLRAQTSLNQLPVQPGASVTAKRPDWLLNPAPYKAGVYRSSDNRNLVLDNGLVRRTFRITPNVASIDYVNLVTGKQLLRSVKAEARLTVDGKDYDVGGLHGQTQQAYLLAEWVDRFTAGPTDFQYRSFDVAPITPTLKWTHTYWASTTKFGTGKVLTFHYRATAPELAGMVVHVHYELYDGMPLIAKSLTIDNATGKVVKLDRVVNEILGAVEEESAVVGPTAEMKPPQGIYVETNYAFNNSMTYRHSDQTTHWRPDSTYQTQVNYDFLTPCILEVYESKAPGIEMQPGERFESVRTHELMMDNDDRERRGLAVRHMYRTIAPWVTGNPIFMHVVAQSDDQVRTAIDQSAATGYEAVIISFGGYMNMEDTSAATLQKWKALADYAHSKHILLGGYSLFSSRRISDADDVIDPKTGKPGGAMFGHAPCFGSRFGLFYHDAIKKFFETTGFDLFENDGPYPGDVCGSTTHPGHKNLDDSQWRQIAIQKDIYHWMNQRGIYINSPDWYFLDGSNKVALGYRENNFSKPRAQQRIVNRQNIYDAMWEKLPSMGWGFVPLTDYGVGGPEAVIEPLSEHLSDYEQLMMQYYGAGIQACYRGFRLYDTEATKATVIRVVSWYKKYRDILNSEVVHLRRADGKDWDGILHVNPALPVKGLMMLYNPLDVPITRTINVPLYYTGLTTTAKIREKDGVAKTYTLNRDYSVDVRVVIAPQTYTWLTVQ